MVLGFFDFEENRRNGVPEHMARMAGFTLAAELWGWFHGPYDSFLSQGGLALPVWISYMQTALRNVPVMESDAPEGLVHLGNEWYYEEYTKSAGVGSVGTTSSTPRADDSKNTRPASPADSAAPAAAPVVVSPEEKKSIFDLFRD